jgi:hypothetical protein
MRRQPVLSVAYWMIKSGDAEGAEKGEAVLSPRGLAKICGVSCSGLVCQDLWGFLFGNSSRFLLYHNFFKAEKIERVGKVYVMQTFSSFQCRGSGRDSGLANI